MNKGSERAWPRQQASFKKAITGLISKKKKKKNAKG